METIRFLDGKFYDRKEVLENMMQDSYYYGFLADKVLSSSILKKLLDSPKAYQSYLDNLGKEENVSALIAGRYLHTRILEPEKVELYFETAPVKNRDTQKFAAFQAASDKEVLSINEYDQCERMISALLSKTEVQLALKETQYELPACGEVHGLPFRAKADMLGERGVMDLKTTSSLARFKNAARYTWHYDVQALLYSLLFEKDPTEFKFICVDKKTYQVGIFGISPRTLEYAAQKLERACNIYHDYFGDDAFFEQDDYVITDTL